MIALRMHTDSIQEKSAIIRRVRCLHQTICNRPSFAESIKKGVQIVQSCKGNRAITVKEQKEK